MQFCPRLIIHLLSLGEVMQFAGSTASAGRCCIRQATSRTLCIDVRHMAYYRCRVLCCSGHVLLVILCPPSSNVECSGKGLVPRPLLHVLPWRSKGDCVVMGTDTTYLVAEVAAFRRRCTPRETSVDFGGLVWLSCASFGKVQATSRAWGDVTCLVRRCMI